MIIISQVFLYFALSIITGAFIFGVVPNTKQPAVHVPKPLLFLCIAAVPILSFFPLLQVIFLFYENTGFWQIFQSVLFSFEIGQSWLITLGVSILLLLTMILPVQLFTRSLLGLTYTFILILALSWGSHAASIAGWSGMLIHSLHLLAVSVWIGALLMAAWFSRGINNWRPFLSWFHPLAVSCVLVTIGAGIFLMFYGVTTETYLFSWVLPYGQALLIKHLLVVPLIFYAFINGYLMKKRLHQETEFNPKPWTKAESVIIFFIFAATAALGEAAPPHDPEGLLRAEGPAWLFQLFHPQAAGTQVALQWNLTGISMLAMAALFLALLLLSFIKKAPAAFSLMMSVLAVVSGYLALMLSIQV